MTLYSQGSESEAFNLNPISGGVVQTEDTTAAYFFSDGARASVRYVNNTGQSFMYPSNLTGDSFFHVDIASEFIGPSTGVVLYWYNDAGVAIYRLNVVSLAVWQMQYLNASAVWTNIGATINVVLNTVSRMDFRINPTVGIIEVWKGGTNIVSQTFTSVYPHVREIRSQNPSNYFNLSQVMLDDTTTVNNVVKTVVPTSLSSTDTGGTGAVTDFNEIVLNDGTYMELTATGQQRAWLAAARTFTRLIKGVTMSGRILRVDATGPQSVKPYVKIGATRYYGTTYALTTGFLQYQYTWVLNPSTGVAWTTAQANDATLEFGWEAVA